MQNELTSFSVQELEDLYNQTMNSELSTGFVQRGLMNIESELAHRGYKMVRQDGGKRVAVLQEPKHTLAQADAEFEQSLAIPPSPYLVEDEEPECPEGYHWNGRQCLKQDNLLRPSVYEREGF